MSCGSVVDDVEQYLDMNKDDDLVILKLVEIIWNRTSG